MTLLFTLALLACPAPPELERFEIAPARDYQIADLPVDVEVRAVDADGEAVEGFCGPAEVSGLEEVTETGEVHPLEETPPFSGGTVVLERVRPTGSEVAVSAGEVRGAWEPDLRELPGFLSIVPPLFAIALAIIFRQALVALVAGIWMGALFMYGWNPLTALLRVFDTHLPAAILDSGHAAIILFTVALGGMVGVMSRSGGTGALIGVISRRAQSRRAAMTTSWASGLVVFFDDYANCLLVGNTLRPYTDALKISREKLAYIVDSTAAPVSTIALISTWIGFQLTELESSVPSDRAPYELFLDMIPYSFYAILTLLFVLAIALSRRDFGPMLKAERRAASGGGVLRPGAKPLMDRELTEMKSSDRVEPHWMTAVAPVVGVVLIVAIGLYASGLAATDADDPGLRDIIKNADSYAVLLWASFGGSIIALAAAIARRSLRFDEGIEAWVTGAKSMVMAVLILVLAWGIGDMCKEYLQTGPWILSQFSPSPHVLPVLTFLVCGLIAFATGSSFSTMAIVFPIAGPMVWKLTGDASGLDPGTVESVRLATLASVLSGAVFGDHCSPISDTTIMSSMSSAADHVDHVRTQAPYALLCAAAAALIGYLPAGFGFSPFLSLPIALAALLGVLYWRGRRAVDPSS